MELQSNECLTVFVVRNPIAFYGISDTYFM